MVTILPTLIIGLFGLVSAQDTHVVDISEPSYVYNGNIDSDTGPGDTWELNLLPGAQSVEFNGDISLVNAFIVTGSPGVSSLDFTYHGGKITLGDANNGHLFQVNNTKGDGPLTAILTGDELNSYYPAVNILGAVGQKNTLFMDFKNFTSSQASIANIEATFHGYPNIGTFNLYNSTAYIDTENYINNVFLSSSSVWFDGKFELSGTNTSSASSLLGIFYDYARFDRQVAVIDDTVPDQTKYIAVNNIDLSAIRGFKNNYIAFVSDILSTTFVPSGFLVNDPAPFLIVETAHGNFYLGLYATVNTLNPNSFVIEDITVNKNGTDHVVHAIRVVNAFYEPPEKTTTVTKSSTTETDVISYFPTVDTNGKTRTGSTTYTLSDTQTYSQPPVTTATVTKDSTTETDVISYFPTVGSDGKTHTGSTTYTLMDRSSKADSSSKIESSSMVVSSSKVESSSMYESSSTSNTETYSQPSESTAYVTKNSTTETDVISYFPTVDSDGKTHTGSTTYTLSDNTTSMSESVTALPATTILETDIVSDNQTIHEVVIESGYTDSDGHIATTTWTELTMDMVDADPVYLSSSMVPFTNSSITNSSITSGSDAYTQPPVTTTTVTVNDTTETIVITYCPIVGSDGKTHTSTSKSTVCNNDMYTQPPVTTATVSKEGGVIETVVVSCYPSVGSDGKTHTGSSVSTLSNGAKPTSGITSGSSGSSVSSASGSHSGPNAGSNAGSQSNLASSGTHSASFTSGVALQSTSPHATVNSVQYAASGSTTVNSMLLAAMMVLLQVV
ncbi:hypothetical protein RNJ44_00106 [Nakaseomyces bracarensis]|uniref:Hyphally-regulated cell wall protein N-terminal domain-containing protein n=1 Tax=Nakaseomyces bracarensis TaxID=273131 RepID=A0ABR4P1H1_9SACH